MLTPLAGNYSSTGGTCDRIRTTSPNLGSRLAWAESLIPVDPSGKFFRAERDGQTGRGHDARIRATRVTQLNRLFPIHDFPMCCCLRHLT
jgi:hypothetical protein